MKQIALSGYYGFANAGDEAVLAGLVQSLRETPGGGEADLSVAALSIDPAQTERDHGISSAHRYKASALVRALSNCDLLASGGGSLLQDVTSKHSIFYYLGVVRAAQIMGKRTMFIAQGIGPLRLARSRRLTASVARRCDAITVRDTSSAALLAEIGVKRPDITVTADPAILLSAEHTASNTQARGAAISLRPWPGALPGFAATVAQATQNAMGNQPIASMEMSPDDKGIHGDFYKALSAIRSSAPHTQVDRTDAGWRALSELSAGAELVIGMRLHALILAAANGTPAAALAYDPKIAGFMEQTGQADAVFDILDSDTGKLTDLIGRVWDQRSERAERLRERLPSLRTAAMKNAEIAVSVLRPH